MHLSVQNVKRQSLFIWEHINNWEAIQTALTGIEVFEYCYY